jgi:hypothetical protein
MSELRDRGLALAADALAKSVEHVQSFFRMLQAELAFYVGCLNLLERLLALRAPFIFPDVSGVGFCRLSCRELLDVLYSTDSGFARFPGLRWRIHANSSGAVQRRLTVWRHAMTTARGTCGSQSGRGRPLSFRWLRNDRVRRYRCPAADHAS